VANLTRERTAPSNSVDTQESVLAGGAARKVLAVVRLAVGFLLVWAFVDKLFGFGYSTASAKAWIHGGAPSQGFLGHLEGPFAGFFGGMASTFSDVLFMFALLAIGAAVMLGIGLRVAAVAGPLLMLMMWMAEFPITLTGSTNPLVDYHVIYGLLMVFFALTFAGDTWGLGKWWRGLAIVQQNAWLR
jgi:thiosulfate dehydrogenase [quinone] large subunit